MVMEQLELFTQDKKREHIKEKDQVYLKNNDSKIIPIKPIVPGIVTKIENKDNERVCHVFFGGPIVEYKDYQLTKIR